MIKEFTNSYFLSAAECNPQGEMPIQLLMERIIEIATLHANSWGVGYASLIQDNQVWVLSRATIEMQRYPRVNEDYSLVTWIEDYNRYFSQRNMEIRNQEGRTIGFARTIWMVINFSTRESMDISKLNYISQNVTQRPCPIAPQGRLKTISVPSRFTPYTFRYTECDLNRHVNTTRYLELLINQFTLDFHDVNFISRIEMAFIKETTYGEDVIVNIDDSNPLDCFMSIDSGTTSHCRAHIVFAPRNR